MHLKRSLCRAIGLSFLYFSCIASAGEVSFKGVRWKNAFEHAVNVQRTPSRSHHGKLEGALNEFLSGPTLIAEADIRFNSKGELVMAHDVEDRDSNRLKFK